MMKLSQHSTTGCTSRRSVLVVVLVTVVCVMSSSMIPSVLAFCVNGAALSTSIHPGSESTAGQIQKLHSTGSCKTIPSILFAQKNDEEDGGSGDGAGSSSRRGGGGGFFSGVKSFFEELDAFVDDASARRLGNGAKFYGKRKSNFYGENDSMKKADRNKYDAEEDYRVTAGGNYKWVEDENGVMRPVTRLKNKVMERDP